MNFSTLRW